MGNIFKKIKEDKKNLFEFIVQIWSVMAVIAALVVTVFVGIKLGGESPRPDSSGNVAVVQQTPFTPKPQPTDEYSLDISEAEDEEDAEEDKDINDLDKNEEAEKEKSEKGKTYYTTTVVNLRNKPSTTAAVLAKLSAKEPLTYVKKVDNEWSQVIYEGKKGYITSAYLTDKLESASAVVTQVPNTTLTPRATKKPRPMKTPKPVKTPRPTKKPRPKKTEKPITATPRPTKAPVPTEKPTPESTSPASDETEG